MNKNSNEMLNKIMQAIRRRRIHASISYNTPLNNSNTIAIQQIKNTSSIIETIDQIRIHFSHVCNDTVTRKPEGLAHSRNSYDSVAHIHTHTHTYVGCEWTLTNISAFNMLHSLTVTSTHCSVRQLRLFCTELSAWLTN